MLGPVFPWIILEERTTRRTATTSEPKTDRHKPQVASDGEAGAEDPGAGKTKKGQATTTMEATRDQRTTKITLDLSCVRDQNGAFP